MRCFFANILVALFAISFVVPAAADTADNVVKLSKYNFDSLVGQGHWFIKFYAPWCAFCKKMAPTWIELADTVSKKQHPVTIGEFDCTSDTDFCKNLQVTGYPTLYFFARGTKKKQFKVTGSLTHDQLLDWVKDELEADGVSLEVPAKGPTRGPEYRTGLFSFLKVWPTASFLVNVYLLISFLAFMVLISCWCLFAWMYHTDENYEDHDDRPQDQQQGAPKERKKDL